PTGHGRPHPGDQDDKSPVTGDCHAGIRGSRGVKLPPATRHATPSGTPQGAILSPLLANVALSVLDRHFQAAWAARTNNQRVRDRAKGRPSYRMIRYADDFVVLVRGSKADAQALKEQTAEFMREQMHLTLSPEKTQIT